MMKYLIIFLNLIILTGCSNWNYKNIEYERYENLEKIHVHLYQHDSCEWNCLYLKEDYGIFVDTFRIKYKTDKKGIIKKVKLIK